MELSKIIEKVNSLDCNLVEVTGGEPLLQDGCINLLHALTENNNQILLETGGALSIKDVPQNVKIILDLKCPSSICQIKIYGQILSY